MSKKFSTPELLKSAPPEKTAGDFQNNFRKNYGRFKSLRETALHIWKNQGAKFLFSRFYSFLRGERQNTNLFDYSKPAQVITEDKIVTEYSKWIQMKEPSLQELEFQKNNWKQFKYQPLISILVPVYNSEEETLKKMISSVFEQTYPNWELCLVEGGSTENYIRSVLNKFARQDNRVKVKFLNINNGISANTNKAIEMANGDFIALLDHDDELAPDALYENVSLLNKHPDADMIYSDEDKLDLQAERCDPYFKPDWSPDLFCSSMYTCHLGIYRTSLVKKVGGFRKEFDGAQDWDLVLRLSEHTDKIYHIPKILYHWRQTENSTALNLDKKDYAKAAQINAVAEHFKRLKIPVKVTDGLAGNLLRVKRLFSENPLVSIIIPTRDKVEILEKCISSILHKSSYQNYEIIVIDNNSDEPETLEYFEKISKIDNIRVVSYTAYFNFAAINNFAVDYANGDFLLFLNNDTEVISSEWLESMIEHAARPEVGAVGARLLYTDTRVQHAGVIIGIGGVAGHSHKYFSYDHPGYFSRAKAIQNLSAVTAACMMVRKEVFNELNGFNEEKLAVAFNDIDFCLRIRRNNLLIIYTPYAELYHHESISRGLDDTPENARRFQHEVEYMLDYWKEVLLSDPYYNPNLTLDSEDFSIQRTFD